MHFIKITHELERWLNQFKKFTEKIGYFLTQKSAKKSRIEEEPRLVPDKPSVSSSNFLILFKSIKKPYHAYTFFLSYNNFLWDFVGYNIPTLYYSILIKKL